MNKIRRKLRKANGLARYSYYILLIGYVVGYVSFTKNILALNGVETFIRIVLLIIFLLWILFYGFYNLLNLITKKYKPFIFSSIVTLMLTALLIASSYVINIFYSGLGIMQDKDKTIYTSYLIKLKDTEFNEKSTIGRISNEEDIEGYELTDNIIVEHNLNNKIVSYDDYFDMIYSLYDKKVDAVFVTSNYVALYKGTESLENIESDTEIVYQYTENINNANSIAGSNKDFSEPLTFLIMGVDSTKDGLNPNAAFNGDTLMLVSFNPKTLDTLMISIPRDTYVPIACNNNRYAKINSSAAYGSSCVVETIENLLDVDIDYYVKINFKGVVNLVEAVHGIEVDVEKPTYGASKYGGKMCEQNSDRQFGDKLVCIEPGLQTLNGEQALAYARNRHLYIGGDLDRVRHQQQVVEALAKKLLNFSSLADFKEIYAAVSNNIATNMDQNKILSGYSVLKEMALNALNGEEFINVNKAYLETYSLPVYLPNSGRYTSAQGYYKDSLEDVKDAIKIVLEQKEVEPIKTFAFSVNEEYSAPAAGKGKRKEKSLETMPNLIGSNITKAEEFCQSHNMSLKKQYVDVGDAHYNKDVAPGLIGDQSITIGTLVTNSGELTIYIPNASPTTNSSTTNNNNNNSQTDANKENEEEIKDIIDNANLN